VGINIKQYIPYCIICIVNQLCGKYNIEWISTSIQDSGLYRILVYSGFWFIQDSGLFRILVYSGFWFIQDSGLYRILVYSGFWFIQDSGLYRILVYSGFPCINQNPV
jgi:hypothetical protein